MLVVLEAMIFLVHAQSQAVLGIARPPCFQELLLPVSPLAKRKWLSSRKCVCLAHGARVGIGITGL